MAGASRLHFSFYSLPSLVFHLLPQLVTLGTSPSSPYICERGLGSVVGAPLQGAGKTHNLEVGSGRGSWLASDSFEKDQEDGSWFFLFLRQGFM